MPTSVVALRHSGPRRCSALPAWEEHCVPLAAVSKRQSCVSHSTPEAELVALTYALRHEGLPGLSLWEVWRGLLQHAGEAGGERPEGERCAPSGPVVGGHVSRPSSRSGDHGSKPVTLVVHEDNSALVKCVRSGRNPTMRHLLRTHRVGVRWLYDLF